MKNKKETVKEFVEVPEEQSYSITYAMNDIWQFYNFTDYDTKEPYYVVENLTRREKTTYYSKNEAFSFWEHQMKMQQVAHRAYIDGIERDIKRTKLRFFDV